MGQSELSTNYLVNRLQAIVNNNRNGSNLEHDIRALLDDVETTPHIGVDFETIPNGLQHYKLLLFGTIGRCIAHDFNNLLTVITGYTENLMGNFDTEDSIYGDLKEVSNAGKLATEIVASLLKFSQEYPYETRDVDLNQAILDLDKILSSSAGNKTEFAIKTADIPVVLRTDYTVLTIILISVALYTRELFQSACSLVIKPSVMVYDRNYRSNFSSINPGNYSVVHFDYSSRIIDKSRFRALFRGTNNANKAGILDIGLVGRFVKFIGGSIDLRFIDNNLARLSILFPLADFKFCPDLMASYPTTPFSGNDSIRLLSDNKSLNHAIVSFLRAYGYRVEIYCDCPSSNSSSKFVTTQPNVILVDENYSECRYREACARYPDAKIIKLLATERRNQVSHESLRPIIIEKPIELDLLLSLIRSACRV